MNGGYLLPAILMPVQVFSEIAGMRSLPRAGNLSFVGSDGNEE